MSITSTEIETQPALWRRAAAGRDDALRMLGERGERVLYLGCGTSAFVAESIAALREASGYGESDAAYASEWRPGRRYDRVVALSRSGTTSEVLEALRLVEGVPTVGVTGVADIPMASAVDDLVVYDYADERSVVQTRFPTTLLAAVRAALGADVEAIASEAEALLASAPEVDVAGFAHQVALGTSWTYGLAQEAALKVREAAQAWSESYPMLDYRHGPIAVAGTGSLVRIFGTAPAELIEDIRATGATVLADDRDPLVQLVAAQRGAVALAASRGLDPDLPRHLTRSVILS